MKLSQIEKRIQQTLTNSKDIIQKDREQAHRRSRARSTRGQKNEAWALYKKKVSPGSPRATFPGNDTSFAQSHPFLLEVTARPPPPEFLVEFWVTKGRSLWQAFLEETVETGTKNRCMIEATHLLRRKVRKD